MTGDQQSDYLNPDHLFSVTETALLLRIARGEIDATRLAREEMANRGLDIVGARVGFDAAKRSWRT